MKSVNGLTKTSAAKPQGLLPGARSWGAGGGFFIDGVGANGQELIPYFSETDVQLPEQYLRVFGRNSRYQPEKRLMLAILEDAMDCFQRCVFARRGKRARLFREAEEWILEQDKEWLFSFENICDTLGLDPGYLRSGLMAWKEKMRAQSLSHNPVTSIAFGRGRFGTLRQKGKLREHAAMREICQAANKESGLSGDEKKGKSI